MLNLNLELNLATGDKLYVQSDNLNDLHQTIGYLQSIGALRSGAPIPPPPANNDSKPDPAEPKTSGETKPEPAPAPEQKTAPEQKPEKPKRQSRKSTAGAAAPAAANDATAETPAAPATDDKKAEAKHKPEDVTKAVTDLANATSLTVARDVLGTFSVKRAAELKPEQYADFIKACEEKIAAAAGEDASEVL